MWQWSAMPALGDGEDDFAELLAFFEIVVGSDGVVEGPDFVDDGFEATLSHKIQNGSEFRLCAHVRAHDGELPCEQEAQIDSGVVAGGRAAGDQAAAVGEAFDAVVPSGSADVLDDNIDAAVVGEASNFLDDGHDAVVDDFVGADFFCFGKFVVITRRGDDVGSEEFGDLDGGAADSAARRENQDCLTGLELRPMNEHVPGGLENKRHRRGMSPIEVFGIGEAVDLRTANEFGVAPVDHVAKVGEIAAKIIVTGEAGGTLAAGDPRSKDDLLSDVDGVNRGSDFGDFSGDVAAGDMRERNGNSRKTAANPEVEMVQGAGVDADESIGWSEVGLVDIRVMEDAGIAVVMEKDGFHGSLVNIS
jgi:hypothetical protein